jgi:Mrp family chromosome partitioning ATPase
MINLKRIQRKAIRFSTLGFNALKSDIVKLKVAKKQARSGPEAQSFELLRAAVESAVERPGVVAVTSAVAGDGKAAASHGLAASLGSIGYRTLLIDISPRQEAVVRLAGGASIEDVLLESSSDSVIPKLRVVSLTAPMLRELGSLPSVARALAAVRASGRYDYVVVNAGCALSTAVSAHIVNSADAVLVAIRSGRRRHAEDKQLFERLTNLGAPFFGVVAVGSEILEAPSPLPGLRGTEAYHANEAGHLEPEPYLRSARPRAER